MTELIAAISAIIKIVEKASELLKGRESDRALLFKEVIDPFYKEFNILSDNYAKVFEGARDTLNNEFIQDLKIPFAEIKTKRNEFQHTRARFREEVKALNRKIADPQVKSFLAGMVKYFYATKAQWDIGTSSGGYFIELWSRTIDKMVDEWRFDKEDLLEFVEEVLEEMNIQLNKVQKQYGELKGDLLVPTRFK